MLFRSSCSSLWSSFHIAQCNGYSDWICFIDVIFFKKKSTFHFKIWQFYWTKNKMLANYNLSHCSLFFTRSLYLSVSLCIYCKKITRSFPSIIRTRMQYFAINVDFDSFCKLQWNVFFLIRPFIVVNVFVCM